MWDTRPRIHLAIYFFCEHQNGAQVHPQMHCQIIYSVQKYVGIDNKICTLTASYIDTMSPGQQDGIEWAEYPPMKTLWRKVRPSAIKRHATAYIRAWLLLIWFLISFNKLRQWILYQSWGIDTWNDTSLEKWECSKYGSRNSPLSSFA